MLGLDVTDDGLDGGAALHLAADGSGDAPGLTADPDAELVGMFVAAIALVDMDAAGLDTREPFQVLDHRLERVAIIGVAVQRLGVERELAALGRGHRCGDRDLATELIGRSRLALADAFDLGRVQRVDLGAALALLATLTPLDEEFPPIPDPPPEPAEL